MVKEEKRIETVYRQKLVYYCDDCSKNINQKVSGCDICGKHLCPDCYIIIDDGSDYPERYCKSCWTKGEEYRKQKEELEAKIEELYDKWIEDCGKFY